MPNSGIEPGKPLNRPNDSTVLAVDEPKLLSYTWGDDEVLRFELLAEGEGTRLVLTDQLQASWAARNAAGCARWRSFPAPHGSCITAP